MVLSAVWHRLRNHPFTIDYAVTQRCNSRCVMCSQWKLKPTRPELSLDEIDKVFRSYRNFKVVGITGGEPSLRDDLSQIALTIARSQKNLKRLFITTNGYLTDKIVAAVQDILAGLENTRVLTVLVSLDGPEDIHNEVRGVPFAYEKATETFRALHDLKTTHKFNLGLSVTYSPYNYIRFFDVLDELKQFNEKYGAESVVCVTWTGNLWSKVDWSWDYLNCLPVWVPEIKSLIRLNPSVLARGRCVFYDLARPFLYNPKKQVVPCEGARIRYFLNAYGAVFPCVVWDRKIASVREMNYDFKAIIKSAARRKIRREIEKQRCPVCFLTCELIPAIMAHPVKTLWTVLSWKMLKWNPDLPSHV